MLNDAFFKRYGFGIGMDWNDKQTECGGQEKNLFVHAVIVSA